MLKAIRLVKLVMAFRQECRMASIFFAYSRRCPIYWVRCYFLDEQNIRRSPKSPGANIVRPEWDGPENSNGYWNRHVEAWWDVFKNYLACVELFEAFFWMDLSKNRFYAHATSPKKLIPFVNAAWKTGVARRLDFFRIDRHKNYFSWVGGAFRIF